jgi:putative hemolysin
MLEIIELSSILIFLLFSFIYSGSEVALLSIPDHEQHKLAQDNNRKSIRILNTLRHPQRALITVLVGNMIVNIGAAIVGQQLSETVFASNQLFYSVFIMTFLVLLFGEIVPKNFASSKPVLFSKLFIPVLEITYRIFYPVVLILGKLASRGKDKGATAVLTKDELTVAVETGSTIGLDHSSVRLLKNLIRIIDTPITEIMVPRSDIVGVDINDHWLDMEKKFLDIPYSTVLFYDKTIDTILGYISKTDLLDAHKKDLQSRIIEPLFVPGTKHILSLLGDFKEQNRYIAVVLDEFGGTTGLVTMRDILDTIFIKDILVKHYLEQKDRYTWVVKGTMKIQDLNEALQIGLPTDYSTISGFVLDLVGGVPKPGSTLEIAEAYILKIVKSDEKQVELMEIRKRDH